MNFNFSSRFNRDLFDRLPKEIDRNVQRAIRKTTLFTEEAARRYAPRDTGALAASIYHSLKSGDTYSSHLVKATAKYSKKHKNTLPSDPPVERPTSPYEGKVAFSAAHGRFVLFGTKHQAAQDFMAPAARDGQKAHKAFMAEALRDSIRKVA